MILCNIYIDLYTLLLLFSDLLLFIFATIYSICISNRHKAMANCYFAIFHFCIMMFIHYSAIASIPMFAILLLCYSCNSAILAILLFLQFCYSCNSAILAILLFLQFCYCVHV